MTDEQVYELAQLHGWPDDFGRWNFKDDGLLDFVDKIQKAEREACAKVCETLLDEDGYEAWNTECAQAIRARGNHD